WHLIRILGRDPLVHLEQVAVALLDLLATESLDGVPEIEIHAASAFTDAAPFVAHLLRGARRDVTRRQVAEARILALEVVVAILLGDVVRTLAAVFLSLGHPH